MITADGPEPCVIDSQLLDLPASVLTMILQNVPLLQRLGVCTRVCHALHTAAVAVAIDSISITRMRSQAQCDNVVKWLQLHGGGVTSLDIQHGGGFCLACLPWPALQDLNLCSLSVQAGFVSTCTGLTRLLLTGCCLLSSPHASSKAAGGNPLTQLSVICSLQHLELDNVRSALSHPGYEFPGSLMSQLVQPTCLKLQCNLVQSDAALQHLSALSALQHLKLNLQDRSHQQPTAAALTGLKQLPQLTALKLVRVPWAINLHTMPGFTVLTALRVLHLEDITSVDPAVLATSSQLQELELACWDPWDAEGAAAMLAAIGQLHELVKLEICHNRCWSTPSAAAYSALTASSHLQHLKSRGCSFPAGAWQQMFPPTRCLPDLRQLDLYPAGRQVQPLSQADIQALVSCCPGLGSLILGRQLPVETATPLQQLTGLTSLGMCASFEDSAPCLAQLATLQRLVVQSKALPDRVTVSGLLQLTALQQLCHLQVIGAAFDPGLTPGLRTTTDSGRSVFLEVGPVWFVLSLPWSVGSAAHHTGGD